jgi:hypothetical protein
MWIPGFPITYTRKADYIPSSYNADSAVAFTFVKQKNPPVLKFFSSSHKWAFQPQDFQKEAW